ncbi:MAG: 3-dehydroquinate synthase family protein [Candidatus Zixiibacteriota bacterium]
MKYSTYWAIRMINTIEVNTHGLTYPVLVGEELEAALADLLKRASRGNCCFLIFDANFYALHGQRLVASLRKTRLRYTEFVVPSGEKTKSDIVLSGIYDFLLGERISRDDLIVAVGGGVTSDLVGYAASTVLRGVNWAVVPTTLLGMVDAAIGGKTGINHRQGKNLIGAFWQPLFVCCDVRFLMTLSERQIVAGLGEVLKCAGLSGLPEIAMLSGFVRDGDLYDSKALTHLVHFSAEYKADVVSKDERDTSRRLVLNYGHTFAHGIEKALGYGKLLHGEAVIIGIDAALALGERCGYRIRGLTAYRTLVGTMMGLLPKRKIDPARVIDAMALDKKRLSGEQRFVLLRRIGSPVVETNVKPALVAAAIDEAISRYREYGDSHA